MGNKKSTTSSQASATSENRQGRINLRMIQNVLLIWLDSDINSDSDDYKNTIVQLRHSINYIETFTDGDKCIQFLEAIEDEKVCMIIAGSFGQHIVPRIHDMSQVDSIFIFCANKKYHEGWAKDWPKIKGVCTDLKLICEALRKTAQRCEHNAVSISFMATTGESNNVNLDRLDPSFMYMQILKEILFTIQFEPKHFKEYIDYCRKQFEDNDVEFRNVKQLEGKYRDKTPIWWYTYECFLYKMLNRALRTMDADIIVRMGFYIKDLHNHIEQLHSEQFKGQSVSETFTAYRGQQLSKTDFEQLTKTKGGLMAFNNFLSTSRDRDVSLTNFTQNNPTDPNMIAILFVITIDPSLATTPFASINEVSYFGGTEDEILFSMQSVFRIRDIKRMDENNRLYQVDLTLTSDNDKDLRALTARLRAEIPGEGWNRLGELLRRMGQFDKAQEVYQVLFDQTTDEGEKADFYQKLAMQKYSRGEYQDAIKLYEKALEIYRKTLPPNHISLATAYNNIGLAYADMGDYSKALSHYEKDLAIKQKSHPPNHPDLSASYNNIGGVYLKMGDYPKALSYYEKNLAIRQQSLPPNHPDLGASYSNIGNVYHSMGDYPKALSNHNKALAIQQQSLPPNHPDLGASYNNIGNLYLNMGDYPKALSNHEKALKIKQQSLPPNHPDLSASYNNIGGVYYSMGDYPKALSYYEKALAIRQQSLPPNHPDLGRSYNNIGGVYDSMGDYPKALSYYEKDLAISKQSLPPNHSDLGISYNNIGAVYLKMDDYPRAISYYEKALTIRQQSLPPNHPDMGTSYNNIGRVCLKMGDYPKALSYYEKDLAISKQSLPPNYSDLSTSYSNIGNVYLVMDDYSKALSHYEKALVIQQQSLPPNHPDFGMSYNNMGLLYENMKDYSKARSYYERAVKIAQQSLPSTDPTRLQMEKNLERIKQL